MTAQTRELLRTLRTLHDRLTSFTVELAPQQLRERSYDTEWTVAQVLSHLGSGAELALLRLRSGDPETPSYEQSVQVWATWDARTPEQQAVESMAAEEAHVAALEELDDDAVDALRRNFGGGFEVDATHLLRLQVSEQAMHSWDVVVAFDEAAVLWQGAVPAILDVLPMTVAFATQPYDGELRVRVRTSEPDRDYLLEIVHSESRVTQVDDSDPPPDVDGELQLPAEAFLRLVYGRLDPRHTPPHKASSDELLDTLRGQFRGF